MLATLREVGARVVPFEAFSGDLLWSRHQLPYPFVLKVGTHHGGLGKALIERPEQWRELADLIYAADDFVTVEPFIPHTRDVRCLLIAGQTWAMERRSGSWRANVDTSEAQLIEVPEVLERWTRDLAARLEAELMCIDALETPAGDWIALESNETPGLSGFPESARQALAMLVNARLP